MPSFQPYNRIRLIARTTSVLSMRMTSRKTTNQKMLIDNDVNIPVVTIAKPVIESAPWMIQFVFAQLSASVQFCLRSEEHTSELQSRGHLVCRLLLEKKITS